MVDPRITYEGPAYQQAAIPQRVELLPNGLWRADFGNGVVRTFDRDPRRALGIELPRRKRSLHEGAHKLYRR